MIDLKSLEEAMTDIESVGHYEHEFEINEKRYVMSPLTAAQDREVFEYAETALEGGGGDDSQAASIAYMDKFRIAAISQALVVIGNLDLRGVDVVETGAVLDNGIPERVSRYQAVRRFVDNWTKPMIEQFFLQFGEMSNRIEDKARNFVRYTPADLSAEIDHIGERLNWVDEQLQKHENPDPDLSAKVHDHIAKATSLQNRQRAVVSGHPVPRTPEPSEKASEESPPTRPPPARRPPTERPRAPEAFTAADRPVPSPRQEEELEPLQPVAQEESNQTQDPRFRKVAPPMARHERPQARPTAPEAAPKEPSPEDFERKFHQENPDIKPGEDLTRYTPTGDSLMGDDENTSIDAEARRQAILRQRRIQREMEEQRRAEEQFTERGPQQAEQSELSAHNQVKMTPGGVMVAPGQTIPGQQRRAATVPAPHREAASVQQAVDQANSASGAQPAGDIQGIPAYALPRQELSHRTRRESAAQRSGRVVVDNPGGGGESLNPRFAGRTRQR